MTTLNLIVTASEDDARQVNDGSVSTNISVGQVIDETTEWGGFRFRNVTIDQGDTINTATLGIVPTGTTNDEPDHPFWGEAADNAAEFTSGGTGHNNISDRARTTATVTWSSANLGATGSSRHNVPDMAAIIQEIVDRGGWANGNALVVVCRGSGDTARDLSPVFYDGSTTNCATLDIDYTAGGGPTGHPAAKRFGGVTFFGGRGPAQQGMRQF